MTLPSSGPLTLSDIQTEFGGTNPIGMNEYYAGGGLVPAGTTGTYGAVPSSGALSVQNFYGTTAYTPTYIEDVFSTYLYTGNGSTQTITNGIDFSTKGGLLWLKARNDTRNNWLYDTTRSIANGLRSDSTAAATSTPDALTAFNNNGFSIGTSGNINTSGNTLVSWSFEKAPKFFDVVTYTGNGASSQTISHNLGSEPGCIIVKCTSNANNWYVYHRGVATPNNRNLLLNLTNAATNNGVNVWNVTSTTFEANLAELDSNVNGATYVAYLFAHNAGGFGLTGTDNVISCGSYTGNGLATGPSITLGYEPQLLIVKKASDTADWLIYDNMRNSGSWGTRLNPNLPNAENSNAQAQFEITSTGFYVNSLNNSSNSSTNTSGATYIYIAIRRGPMKVPTSGTSVFIPAAVTESGNTPTTTTGFPVDLIMNTYRAGNSANTLFGTRLTGANSLTSSSTAAEIVNAFYSGGLWDSNTTSTGNYTGSGATVKYFLRRAPSFMDVLCYTGNGVQGTAITHNLTVAPEIVIVKSRSYAGEDWNVLVTVAPAGRRLLNLNYTTAGQDESANYDFFGTAANTYAPPTASSFQVGSNGGVNRSPRTYIAYLFATCAGVSKVGTYTGTGAAQTINCGFTTGARLVMIKCVTANGSWYVWDSARGIVAGNDPYFRFNLNSAEITTNDFVNTAATGFEITSNATSDLNGIGGSFIFLAIA